MSKKYEHKYQVDRPNPLKPSVVKEYGSWWAKTYDAREIFHTKDFGSQSEALSRALRYAEGDYFEAPSA